MIVMSDSWQSRELVLISDVHNYLLVYFTLYSNGETWG